MVHSFTSPTIGLLAAVMTTVPSPASGQPTSVQVSDSAMPEAMPSADRQRLETSLRDGLAQAGLSVSTRTGDAALRMRVEQADADYVVTLEIVDASGDVSADASMNCELCGVAELSETIVATASRLRQRMDLQGHEATLSVVTRPPAATVLVDGREAGQTPLQTPITAGEHEVVIERDGYRPIATSFHATGGAQSNFDYGLRRQAYRTVVPWTLIGAGALSVAGGAALVAVHGNPIRSGCNADVSGRCEFIRRTRPGGAAAIAVGVGALVTGVVLAVLWRERRSSRGTAGIRRFGGRL